jgi:signal transduction histidine kinase
VWPPTGLALAALLLYGPRLWPGIFVGALVLNFVETGLSWLPFLGIAAGNTLESLVGALLLTRACDFRPDFGRPRDVAAFLLIGVVGCTMISPTLGVSSLLLSGGLAEGQFSTLWLIWWLGDAGSALAITPILLGIARGTPPWRSLLRRFESWAILACLIATSILGFSGLVTGLAAFATALSPLPVLVWAGSRLGPRGATMASFVIILSAALATAMDSGPFVLGDATEAMILLWAYCMFVGSMALTLAAVIEQRDAAESKYRAEEAERLRVEREKLLLTERQRLTREMHDGLGGQLVSALSMVERGTDAPGEVAEVLRRALDEIRIVIDSLDPETTDLPTSLGKLRARLTPLLRRNGVELMWRVDQVPGLDSFPPERTLHLLRIIQESVTTAIRHAKPERVDVSVTSGTDGARMLRVAICDDGCGLPHDMGRGGRGFQNMQKRARELGGVLRIADANPGTSIELTVPIPR